MEEHEALALASNYVLRNGYDIYASPRIYSESDEFYYVKGFIESRDDMLLRVKVNKKTKSCFFVNEVFGV